MSGSRTVRTTNTRGCPFCAPSGGCFVGCPAPHAQPFRLKLDKLIALYRDPAATPGERRNAARMFNNLTARRIQDFRLRPDATPVQAREALPDVSETTLPRLVIPYVPDMLAEETRIFGEEHQADLADVGGDDEAYFQLIARLWSEGSAFIICEHDIAPDVAQYHSMLICGEPWCAGLHRLHADAPEIWSLGLMRFSGRLLRRRFSLLQDGQTAPDGAEMLAQVLGDDRRWMKVDLALYTVLRMGGYETPHLHGPVGRHLHHEEEAQRAAVG